MLILGTCFSCGAGALLSSADVTGGGKQAEGELHGAPAREHPVPG